MTYLYAFNVKINKQVYNKNLYEFCKFYEKKIIMITYEVKKKTYNIIVEDEDARIISEMELKAAEIFKDLRYNKDYETQFIPYFVFNELEKNIYTHRISYNNPRMYLYVDEMVGKFKIEYVSLFIFDTLNKFKISDMEEIICWHMLFFDCSEYDEYERFNIWCVLRYWDEKYKFINIHKFNGKCGKNKKIPKDVKKYINYESYDRNINDYLNFEHEYPYIDISQIPNVFNVINFMEKLEMEADENDDYDEFIIDDYEQIIEKIKEMEEMKEIEKKSLKTIQKNHEMEIADYDLNILFSTDKENSIIENIIFNNEEKEDDYEEYLEIIRIRRIKKSFMIN